MQHFNFTLRARFQRLTTATPAALSLIAGMGLLDACGAKLHDPGTDSSTHWLSYCTEDSACGNGLACICGSCTKRCDTADACSSLSSGGLCSAETCADDREQVTICTRACSADVDCPENLHCENNSCQLRRSLLQSTIASDGGVTTSLPTATANSSNEFTASSTQQPVPPAASSENPTSAVNASVNLPATSAGGMPVSSGAAPVGSSGSDGGTPNCPAMNAEFVGCAGAATEKYYWNGESCVNAPDCACTGSECNYLMSLFECRSRFAACIAEIPVCTDFPVKFVPIAMPEIPAYSVELKPDSASPVNSFNAWQPATWSGPFSVPDSSSCTPGPRCPKTRTFDFKQGDEEFSLAVTFDWQSNPLAPFTDAAIDVMVVGATQETSLIRELRVRDASSKQPVLWVARADVPNEDQTWSYPDLLDVRTHGPNCKLSENQCNLLYDVSDLEVTSPALSAVLGNFEARDFSLPGGVQYTLANSYFLSGNFSNYSGGSCAPLVYPRGGFVVLRKP